MADWINVRSRRMERLALLPITDLVLQHRPSLEMLLTDAKTSPEVLVLHVEAIISLMLASTPYRESIVMGWYFDVTCLSWLVVLCHAKFPVRHEGETLYRLPLDFSNDGTVTMNESVFAGA